MNLDEIPGRDVPPAPFAEGDKIPWHDPAFSARMLKEHLNQQHDLASRRFETVLAQVDWIVSLLPGDRPGRILDLGCGPGLHVHELARQGHHAVGIDFAPASIAWARARVAEENLDCSFEWGDVRDFEYGGEFDLVMMLYGEIDIFTDDDARVILAKAQGALRPGGRILLEPHLPETVRRRGSAPPTWRASDSGLFSDRPHLLLTEAFWDVDSRTATRRHYVVDAETGNVERYAESIRARDEKEWTELLASAGFIDPAAADWPGAVGETVALTARSVSG